jgi:RNase H-fold protein (predicted Holliday junction resolvase)
MAPDSKRSVIAIDPGLVKCGLVLVVSDGDRRIERAVVSTAGLVVELSKLLRQNTEVDTIVIGSGTGSATLARAIRDMFPNITLTLVDEKGTSLLARQRYFKENPPKGWRKLIPCTLQLPQEPYDDYAALLLAERYLDAKSGE